MGRSQILPWEGKSQTLLLFMMSCKGTLPADETEAVAAPVRASTSCLLGGAQPLPLPQDCPLQGCVIAGAEEFVSLTATHKLLPVWGWGVFVLTAQY